MLAYKYYVRASYTRLSRSSYYEDLPSKYFFSYKPLNARKRTSSTDELHTRCTVKIFFSPTSRSSQGSEGFFFRRATYKDTYVEAIEFRQGWSVAKNKGDVKKTKEGGLSPQKGDVRKKKRRRPRKVVCLHKKGM